MKQQPGFLSDIQTIRERARQHIEQGAVTPGYGADRQTVVKLLNEAKGLAVTASGTVSAGARVSVKCSTASAAMAGSKIFHHARVLGPLP